MVDIRTVPVLLTQTCVGFRSERLFSVLPAPSLSLRPTINRQTDSLKPHEIQETRTGIQSGHALVCFPPLRIIVERRCLAKPKSGLRPQSRLNSSRTSDRRPLCRINEVGLLAPGMSIMPNSLVSCPSSGSMLAVS